MADSSNSHKFETFRNNVFSNLPENYGDNKIVVMVRDPWTIYTYWEINKEIESKVREDIEKKASSPSNQRR